MNLTLKTSELRVGDVVHCHGLECLIDQPIRSYPATNSARDEYPLVYRTDALVLNRDDVDPDAVPYGFTERTPEGDRRRGLRPELRVTQPEHRWGIQGNDLAHWSVDRDLTPDH